MLNLKISYNSIKAINRYQTTPFQKYKLIFLARAKIDSGQGFSSNTIFT